MGALPALAPAQADKAKETQAPARETQAPGTDHARELEALTKRLDAARKAFEEKMKAAQSDDEREKLWMEERPEPGFLAEFKVLAEAARGSETAAKALVQVVLLAGDDGQDDAQAAARKLLDEHITSPEIAKLVLSLDQILGEDEGPRALELIKAKNSTRPVQALLLFADAQRIESEQGEHAPELRAIYERLAREFKDVPTPWGEGTIGDVASGWLFVRDNLVQGKVAPNFEAVDENGVKWKLSDYQGKVVVIDFWGEW